MGYVIILLAIILYERGNIYLINYLPANPGRCHTQKNWCSHATGVNLQVIFTLVHMICLHILTTQIASVCLEV